MSTRIDISVAGDLIRRLNRSQQQANRQGLQERERRASLTQRGTIARQEFNRSQGRAADGTPLGRRPLQPRFLEEPAATPLLGTPGFVMVPHAQLGGQGLPALTRRLQPISFWLPNTDGTTISLAGGPGGSGAVIYSNAPNGLTSAIAPTLLYGEVIAKPHTLEAIVDLGAAGLGVATGIVLQYSADSPQGGGGVYLGYQQDSPNETGDPQYIHSSVDIFGLVADMHIYSMDLSSPEAQDQTVLKYPYIVNPIVQQPSTWVHLAYVSSGVRPGEPVTESVYFNGQRIYTATGTPFTPSAELAAQPVQWGWDRGTTFEGSDVKIHGYRYTQKALYSGPSFTPPTTITSPAR